MKSRCRHCQADCAAGAEFCCIGCEAVFHALNEAGLEGFYSLRTGPGLPAIAAGGRRPLEVEPIELRDGIRKVVVGLDGVHCAGCVWLVERMPHLVPGVVEARLNLGRGRLEVRWEPERVDFSGVSRWLERFGYVPYSLDTTRGAAQEARERDALVKVGVSWALAANVMLLIVALYAGLDSGERGLWTAGRWLAMLLSGASLLYGGTDFSRRAWASLVPFRGVTRLGVDVPVTLGLLVGWAYSAWNTVQGSGEVWFDSVAVLIAALLTARWLHARGLRVAADATNRLAAIVPQRASRICADGAREDVPTGSLREGDVVEVRHGDVVPVDGVVVEGTACVDRALLTGEAMPEWVSTGAQVWAGEPSVHGIMQVLVESVGAQTRSGRLEQWVYGTEHREAATVRLADRLAGVFVFTILFGAALCAVLAWHYAPAEVVPRVVALLVVSCPCALGMATPLAFSVATGRAAAQGIFVRDDGVFERLVRVDTVVLDKTGTLTDGSMRVCAVRGDRSALELAAAVERLSSHPIARAFAPYDGKIFAVSSFSENFALGVAGFVDGRQIRVRSADRATGVLTTVAIEVDGEVVAEVDLADTVRTEAADLVAHWQSSGVEVWIASGDARGVVKAVAASLGVPEHRALGGQTPESKLALIERFRGEGRTVVMVGDGVNDAAALRAAAVGIAMAGGAPLNATAADVQLSRTGLRPLAELFGLAGGSMRAVRRNLALSAIYNVVALVAAAAGWVSPLVAAIAMPLSSVAVVASSLAQGVHCYPGKRRDLPAAQPPVARTVSSNL